MATLGVWLLRGQRRAATSSPPALSSLSALGERQLGSILAALPLPPVSAGSLGAGLLRVRVGVHCFAAQMWVPPYLPQIYVAAAWPLNSSLHPRCPSGLELPFPALDRAGLRVKPQKTSSWAVVTRGGAGPGGQSHEGRA